MHQSKTLSHLLLLACFMLSACKQDLPIPSNYLDTSITIIEQKITAQETFTFYFGSDTCRYCEMTKQNAIGYLTKNPDVVLYHVDLREVSSIKRSYYAGVMYQLLGQAYYTSHGYITTGLYVPSTLRYEQGIAIAATIGVIEESAYATWLR